MGTAQTETAAQTVAIECPSCAGAGRIDAFAHIDDGVCYLCDGEGDLGEQDLAEVAAGLAGAARYEFDRKHAPYLARAEGQDAHYPVFFYSLAEAAAWVAGARQHRANGRVTLEHRDGRMVTRGEVRKAGR